MILSNLILILLVWISINTEYDISKFEYSVNIKDKKIIEEQVCKGKCPIVAYFDIKEGIVIAEGKLDDLCYQSILLHEMIHAFQYYSKKDMENSFKELEAYYLQNMYLKEVSEKKDLLVSLNVKSCRSKQHNTLF